MREIGIAIASRRRTVIVPALQVATWIFQKGQESHKESIRQLVEGGLNYLAQELRYGNRHENPEEIPRKRLYCAELAVAMVGNGISKSPAVAHWMEIAKEDPLPEVRSTVERRGSN